MGQVLLVCQREKHQALLRHGLTRAGHEIALSAVHPEDVHRDAFRCNPDLVVIDIAAPDSRMLEGLRRLQRERPCPVIVFSDDGRSETIRAAIDCGVSSFIVGGLEPDRIAPITEIAIARFRQQQALREELGATQRKLEERKIIEQAKGLIMRRRNLGEQEAYHSLRKLAMDRNLRMADVARQVIDASRLLEETG